MKRFITLLLSLLMFVTVGFVPISAQTISSDTTWSEMTLSEDVNLKADKTISVKGKITIDGNVTIEGVHDSVITRDSSYTGTIFEITAGSSLTLINVTIKGKEGSNYTGSAVVVNADSALLIKGATFEHHTLTSGDGAAISAGSNTYVIIYGPSVFNDNKTLDGNGGAIAVAGTSNGLFSNLYITETDFSNNLASKNGGAIYATGCIETSINKSTITGSEAESGDGGAVCTNGSLKVIDSTITGNKAKGNGGSLCIKEKKLTDSYSTYAGIYIENSEISYSAANSGETIYTGGTVNAKDSTILGMLVCGASILNNVIRDTELEVYKGYTVGDLKNEYEEKPISINSAEGLIDFFAKDDLFDAIDYFSKKGLISKDLLTFSQECDIDFSSVAVEVGRKAYILTNAKNFSYDGNGYKMRGLSVPLFDNLEGVEPGLSLENYEYYLKGDELFATKFENVLFDSANVNGNGVLANKAFYVSIINCSIDNSNIANVEGCVGGFVGDGLILAEGLKLNATVIGKEAGGIIGNAYKSNLDTTILSNCKVAGKIKAINTAGGLMAKDTFYNFSKINKYADYDELTFSGVIIDGCNCDSKIEITSNENANAGGLVGSTSPIVFAYNSSFTGGIVLPVEYSANANVGGLAGYIDSGMFIVGGGFVTINCSVEGSSVPDKVAGHITSGTRFGYNGAANTNFTGTSDELVKQIGNFDSLKLLDCSGDFKIDHSISWLFIDASCNIDNLTINGDAGNLSYNGGNGSAGIIGYYGYTEQVNGRSYDYAPIKLKSIETKTTSNITLIGGSLWWNIGRGPATVYHTQVYLDNPDCLKTDPCVNDEFSHGAVMYLNGGSIKEDQPLPSNHADRAPEGFLEVEKEGSIFDGWYTNKECTEGKTETPSSGHYYYVKWVCDHNIVSPTYEWKADLSECTAKGHCSKCTEDITETVATEKVIDVVGTCVQDEKYHYEASFKTSSSFKKQISETKTTDTKKVDKLVKYDGVEPTVIDAGNKDYYYCSECGRYFEDEKGEVLITETIEVWKARYGDGYLEPIPHEVIQGKNQTYVKNSNKDLIIKSNGIYSHLLTVLVDDEILDASNYDSEPGSIIIKLHKDYLEGLGLGTYKLSIKMDVSNIAETTFEIANELPKPDPGYVIPKTGIK